MLSRSFSKLNTEKTKLRSNMIQKRFNSILMKYMEQYSATEVNFDEVIKKF